jgi:maltooligosyltrehalose trehalohydrolase
MSKRLQAPHARSTFEACKLDWREAETHAEALSLHRHLIALRQSDEVLSGRRRTSVDGSVLGAEAFLLRYCGESGDDRLLFFNLGRDMRRRSIPDPLVAPPKGRSWSLLWSSDDPDYGGDGTVEIERKNGWLIPGESACVLRAINSTSR